MRLELLHLGGISASFALVVVLLLCMFPLEEKERDYCKSNMTDPNNNEPPSPSSRLDGFHLDLMNLDLPDLDSSDSDISHLLSVNNDDDKEDSPLEVIHSTGNQNGSSTSSTTQQQEDNSDIDDEDEPDLTNTSSSGSTSSSSYRAEQADSSIPHKEPSAAHVDKSEETQASFPNEMPGLGNEARLPAALEEATLAAISDPDAGRKRLPNGCLPVTEADGIINTLFTKEDKTTKGTRVYRRSVKGTRRHLKIPKEEVEHEAGRIRQEFSQEMKQNHALVYAHSNIVEPTLMVEEKKGIEWKYHFDSQRYYFEKTDKYCRKASDLAIAKAWSEPPHRAQRLLAEEIAELEQDLEALRFANTFDETFEQRANVVQNLFNVFKPDPFSGDPSAELLIAQECHKLIVAMLEKALEKLKPKKPKAPKKRNRDGSSGTGGSRKQQNGKKKYMPSYPGDYGQSSEACMEGEGTAGGPQGSMPHVLEEWDCSDSESQSSADWDESDSESISGDSSNDNDDSDDGTRLVFDLHQRSPSDRTPPAHSSIQAMTMAMEKITLENDPYGSMDADESRNSDTCDEENSGDDAEGGLGSYRPIPMTARSTSTEHALASTVLEDTNNEDQHSPSNEGATTSLSTPFHLGLSCLAANKDGHHIVKPADDGKAADGHTKTKWKSRYYSVDSKIKPTSQNLEPVNDVVSEKIKEFQLAGCDAERTASLLYGLKVLSQRKRLSFAAAGGIPIVLNAMQQHSNHPGVQEQACWAIRKLARKNRDNQVSIAAAGGIPIIIHAMILHSNNAGLQEQGCAALMDLSRNNNDNKVAIASAGGIPVVLDAMRQHSSHAGVQEQACKALCGMALNDDNQVSIAAAGGIPMILDAMRQHFNHAGFQEQACKALCGMALNDDNQVWIAAAGGIPIVLDAMQQHSVHPGVQEQGCAALRNLACNNDNKVLIEAAGGIEIVLNAMRQHSSHAEIQEQGCGALLNLAGNNDDNQVLIAAAGGIPIILDAMQQHSNHGGVQEQVCGALMNLAGNSDNQVLIAAAGGIERIVSAMRQHSNHDGVQEYGCKALYNLSLATENKHF